MPNEPIANNLCKGTCRAARTWQQGLHSICEGGCPVKLHTKGNSEYLRLPAADRGPVIMHKLHLGAGRGWNCQAEAAACCGAASSLCIQLLLMMDWWLLYAGAHASLRSACAQQCFPCAATVIAPAAPSVLPGDPRTHLLPAKHTTSNPCRQRNKRNLVSVRSCTAAAADRRKLLSKRARLVYMQLLRVN
jgi:hypothetical protein